MTERQFLFNEAYLFGEGRARFNATRGAEAVGYKGPAKQGPRLPTFPLVAFWVEAGFKTHYLAARDSRHRLIYRTHATPRRCSKRLTSSDSASAPRVD